MSRYFFHLHENDAVLDDEGATFSDEEAAVRHGVWNARQVIANDILAGLPVRLSSSIVVTDEAGRELRRIVFADVVSLICDRAG